MIDTRRGWGLPRWEGEVWGWFLMKGRCYHLPRPELISEE